MASSIFLTKKQHLFERSEGGSESTIVYIDCNRVIINVEGTNFDFL